ncbi:MAG: fumarate hydratase [bacterium]
MAEIKAVSLAKLVSDEYFKMNLLASRKILDSLYSSKPKNNLQKQVLRLIEENQLLSLKNRTPLCQDTGVLTIFLELGAGTSITGNLKREISKKLNEVTKKQGLRFSVVGRDGKYSNEPVLHILQSDTKKSRIVLMAKGGGSENLTKIEMLSPASTDDDIVDFAVRAVNSAQDRGCPPYILSIGVGESAEESAALSKMALTGFFNHNNELYEKKIAHKTMKRANKLNIGIQGLGFGETIADCRVIIKKRHIAALPVAVMFNCFQERVREMLL